MGGETPSRETRSAGRFRLGVDIGGTFTDLVLLEDGAVRAAGKTPTTPDDPSRAVESGLRALLAGIDAGGAELVHGTTLVSNALIERKGAKTSLVATAGFRDVLEIGREQRYDLYDLSLELPEPLVPRRRRHEVRERVLADGAVELPLTPDEAVRVAARLREEGAESVAVSLLHAYRHPEHERLLGEVLSRKLPGVPVSLSSEVAPELGEYGRTSTAVANAYVRPLAERYLGRLESRLAQLGIAGGAYVMLSTGGLATLTTARARPVLLCESGPAAGVLAAVFRGAAAGERDLLAFDMGGTTAKVSLVAGGKPLVARETEVARVHRFAKGSGLPLRVPVLDLLEVGAGGGSIARVDALGLPKVGPDSAGSEPGPACYGRGGAEATVTDADLLLGYLDPGSFLGGEMRLDAAAARAALARLGAGIGLSAEEAAVAVHRVVNETMAAAARIHAIERGLDLRRFTLVATGGAGPVHAWGVARALGVRAILFPPDAGVASALGMLTAPPAFDLVRPLPGPLAELRWSEVRAVVSELTRSGRSLLPVPGEAAVSVAADVRHAGQGEALTVPLPGALGRDPGRRLEDAFDDLYVRLYGRRPEGVELEVVAWRVRVEGARPEVDAAPSARGEPRPPARRPIWSPERGEPVDALVLDRRALRPGDVVTGPAVVEERESTAVIGLGGVGRVDASGSIRVELDG